MKAILRIFGILAICVLAGELLLIAFRFPNGIQIHESDLRAYDDELVYRLRPNVRLAGKRTPYFVHPEIRTNSMGLRDKEIAVPKPSGTFRILSIGDSYAFGWGVADEETYAKQLERILNTEFPSTKVEVVNAGVPSYESWRELALLRRIGPLLQPDLVVCQVADNDLGKEGGRWKYAGLPVPGWLVRVGRSSRLLTVVSALVSGGVEQVRDLRARSSGEDTIARSEDAVWEYMRALAVENDSAFARNPPWVGDIVDNYARMNDAAGGAFVCLLLPDRFQIYQKGYRDTALRILAAKLSQKGIRAIDLWQYLQARNAASLCLADTHPNPLGHRLIADTLAAYLRQSGFLRH